MTYNIPLQKYTTTRSSEINRVNPAYLNLTHKTRFKPVNTVTYLWILNPDNEVILGIEEPWKHPEAFGFDKDNPEQAKAFESLMVSLSAPPSEDADGWKFGHPTLAVHFDPLGTIDDQGCAYIGGELYYDEEQGSWILDNMSGRYGEYQPFTGLQNREAEKRYQENIINALYEILEQFSPAINEIRIKPSFDQALYDPRILIPADLILNLNGSLDLYQRLVAADQINPLYVRAYVADEPLRLLDINTAFFIDSKESAAEMIERASVIKQYVLLKEFLLLDQSIPFINFYIQKILNTECFKELFAFFKNDKQLTNLFKILDIKALIVLSSEETLQLLLPDYFYYREQPVDLRDILLANRNKIIAAFSQGMPLPMYQNLPKLFKADPEIVNCLMNNTPAELIQVVEAEYFIDSPEHARKYLDDAHGHLVNTLINIHKRNPAFLEFIRCYLEAIFHTPRFSQIIKYFERKYCLLQWFGFQRLMDKSQTIDLDLLQEAKKLGMDLTHLNFKSILINSETIYSTFYFQIRTIFTLLPQESCYHFLSHLMSSKEAPSLKDETTEILGTLNFKELAQLIHINPVHFSTVLEHLPCEKIVSFMHYLVDLDLGTRVLDGEFKINSLFELVFDPSIELATNKKGLTVSPVHAALIKLDITKLNRLFEEFVEIFIYNTQMVMNLLASMDKAEIRPFRKQRLIGTLINRFAELTHNRYQYEKIKSALPSKQLQDQYDQELEKKSITNNDLQIIRRPSLIS